MRQIVNIEKEIAFKSMLGEITSISLEDDLSFINDSEIEGNLIISGTYKMTEASTLEEEFNYKVPVEIMLTTTLEEEKRKVSINNFTYKIVDEEALLINVELLIEGLEKIEILEDDSKEEIEVLDEEVKEAEEVRGDTEVPTLDNKEVLSTNLEEEDSLPSINETKEIEEVIETSKDIDTTVDNISDSNSKEVMNSIFSLFANAEETYSTYSVYILRENETLDEVMNKYKTTREELAEYNDLDNLRVGSKLIIPSTVESSTNNE